MFWCNDVYNIHVTASNMCENKIIWARKLFSRQRFHKCLSFPFSLFFVSSPLVLFSLVNRKFSRLFLIKSRLFFTRLQYGNYLFHNVSYDFLFFLFFSRFLHLEYWLVSSLWISWPNYFLFTLHILRIPFQRVIRRQLLNFNSLFWYTDATVFPRGAFYPYISFQVQITTSITNSQATGLV